MNKNIDENIIDLVGATGKGNKIIARAHSICSLYASVALSTTYQRSAMPMLSQS
jgi:hypothetical protein